MRGCHMRLLRTTCRRLKSSTSAAEPASKSPSATVAVRGSLVEVAGKASFQSPELAALVEAAGPGNEERLGALSQVVSVGAYSLARASAAQRGAALSEDLNRELSAHLERTVTAAVGELLAEAKAATDAGLQDVRDILARDMDPARKDSKLGKALGKVDDLLDAQRSDSLPGVFRESLRAATAADGAMAVAVQKSVAEATRPLQGELERLSKAVNAQAATSALRNKSPAKGLAFEEELLAALQPWKEAARASLEHVGGDNSQGDIIARLPPTHSQLLGSGSSSSSSSSSSNNGSSSNNNNNRSGGGGSWGGFSVVIEAKDMGSTPLGRKRIAALIGAAVEARGCHAGLLICRTAAGLAKECGEWDEGFILHSGSASEGGGGGGGGGQCHWLATTLEHAPTALRYLFAADAASRLQRQAAAAAARDDAAAVDTSRVRLLLDEARAALGQSSQVKRRATDIRKSADAITQEALGMERRIGEALSQAEHEIARANNDGLSSFAAGAGAAASP